MGNCCLPIRLVRSSSGANPKNVTLLLVGLDKSGKTTIARRLAGEPIDSVVPTVGFSVVTLRQKGCLVSIYDLGGGPQIRDIWHRYYADAHGIIFVVDAIATDRMEECRLVLQNLLCHAQISGKPILLLANKQDVDGALDEIDIVDHLNLEKLVNEQKCPTLVELCSALHFTKKIDIGIDNGYKWLIRGIVREYPTLNNRVLRDLAKQEEENKIHVIKKARHKRKESNKMHSHETNQYENPFKPIEMIVHEKFHTNGKVMSCTNSGENISRIPGLVDETSVHRGLPDDKVQTKKFLDRETKETPQRTSFSSEFFLLEDFESDVELLNDVSNQTFKNFLVRPKSSGARLYGVRPEKKKTSRRKPFIKRNKTGPSPFIDLSSEQNPPIRKNSSQATQILKESNFSIPDAEQNRGEQLGGCNPRGSGECFFQKEDPFMVTNQERNHCQNYKESNVCRQNKMEVKSTPNSRKSSANLENVTKRRCSMTSSKIIDGFLRTENISPLKVNNRIKSTKEIFLDVKQLQHHNQGLHLD